ncbi:MAG: M28 family peptidase [Ignavibacteriaceae bacterium]
MIDSVSIDSLTKHIKILENAGGHTSRVNFTAGNDSAAEYIKRTFQSMPHLSSVKTDTFFITSATSPYNTKPLFNIEATILGKTNPNKIFILGAHYDASGSRMGTSVWQSQWKTMTVPGADDNATGVAALFEIARILSDPTNGFFNAYTIKLVAFGAEESGPAYTGAHHGSVSYAKKCKLRGDLIDGMVSIDMIGYNDNYNFQSIVSNNSSLFFAQKFYEANTLFGTGITLNSSPVLSATYSDHASFWDEGYKAILLIENAPPWNSNSFYTANPFYHTSSDSFHTLNMTLVQKVTQWSLGSISAFASPLTDADDEELIRANSYALSQNFPNPFNPTTLISYQLPAINNVSLKIYDVLGKEVASLINEEQGPGSYTVEFNASGLASGAYYFRLKAGEYNSVKKMILMK